MSQDLVNGLEEFMEVDQLTDVQHVTKKVTMQNLVKVTQLILKQQKER
jgi:hypothetical protein